MTSKLSMGRSSNLASLLQPKAPPLRLWKPKRRTIAPPVQKASLIIRPPWAADPTKQRRGLKGRGYTYERAVKKALVRSLPYDLPLLTSAWIEYEDVNGRGVACPDAIVLRTAPDLSIVIECKLTRSADGPVQLAQVYLPLVQHIWPERRWALVHVFKHWAGAELAARPIRSLKELVEREVCDLYLPDPRLLGALQVEPPTRSTQRATGP